MREDGAPPVDQGRGDGLAEHGWGLAGFSESTLQGINIFDAAVNNTL